ncbi:hypothetical protein DL93DRAFT_551972 [Clavulina sp. PMI_390]|nr:hypothetical protein DL93DRAFT_551972 [Clavulina sp. PMI_390]
MEPKVGQHGQHSRHQETTRNLPSQTLQNWRSLLRLLGREKLWTAIKNGRRPSRAWTLAVGFLSEARMPMMTLMQQSCSRTFGPSSSPLLHPHLYMQMICLSCLSPLNFLGFTSLVWASLFRQVLWHHQLQTPVTQMPCGHMTLLPIKSVFLERSSARRRPPLSVPLMSYSRAENARWEMAGDLSRNGL